MRTLYSETDIATAIEALAPQIVDALGKDFIIAPILNGGFIFAADLARALFRHGADPEIDFLQLASYGDERESSGTIKVVKDLSSPVEGQTVLLVDDVLDSGNSLHFAQRLLMERKAAKVAICVAVNKVRERTHNVTSDFTLFTRDADAFLVGYGMDDAGRRRALPVIGVIE
ncbi:phosphoribosyltransferase [Parvularcula sp. LCG005]|uniref:phosphoribosyltransferase n=1 Tax=Parvularcula sp. LCG005 TaxID=3078805 RepID=UPI002942E5D9|nr:phosphoribosyltransferase family protein [Parvularcula sp. LCG005]WOI53645.1 phosphoribosyltransferase family protein [Parvularcula sp. LCG005]